VFHHIPMARPLSPRILAAGFGAYFVATFLGAWFFSPGLPSARYGPEASRWVYAISAIAAVNLMSVLSVIPVVRASAWNPGTNSEISKDSEPRTRPPSSGELDKDRRDDEIDHLIERLSEIQTVVSQEAAGAEGEGGSETASRGPDSKKPSAEASVRGARNPKARGSAFRYVRGPILVALVVLGISAALLPAVESTLQDLYQWNTTLILTFSSWWGGLGAYAAASVYALVKHGTLPEVRKDSNT